MSQTCSKCGSMISCWSQIGKPLQLPKLPPLEICGANDALPARFVGCGKEISSQKEVYRCTHCDVPFHKNCANYHFTDPVITQEMIDSLTPEEMKQVRPPIGWGKK